MNYISFDMGSESMAAYCQLKNNPVGFKINLQEYAQRLLGNVKESEIEYLCDEENGKEVKSTRLKTLISIEDNRQPADLPDSHARLTFIDSKGNVIRKDGNNAYNKSLFGFFYKSDDYSRKVIPNPKIPFQEGAGKIIPEVESKEDKSKEDTSKEKPMVRYKPETLINHLMSQMIRNFVLRSSKLRDKRLGKTNTTLILTVPNVYSMTHAQSIQKFIKKFVNIDNVETIYESDAVAYYALDQRQKYPQMNQFIEDMRGLSKRERIDGYQILTIDIGHGTTDLSLIEISEPQQDDRSDLKETGEERTKFFVKARTGRSEGGSRLNYILAEYYNSRLEEILARQEFKDLKMPFNFLEGEFLDVQTRILAILEKLINAVKKSMNARYEIKLGKQEQEKYIDEVSRLYWIELTAGWSKEEQIEKEALKKQFQEEFRQAFVLKKLPNQFISFICGAIPDIKMLPLFPITRKQVKLKKNIRKYVKRNVVESLKQLDQMALSRENVDLRNKRKTVFEKNRTFVVIAGQASQFKPIRKAIERELNMLNIPGNYRLFLEGDDAKWACSRGAIVYKRAGHEWANPGEIHGTYGFLNEIKSISDIYWILDTKELNEGKKVCAEFNSPSTYWLFFTPRAYHTITSGNHPNFFDGRTALIENFENQKTFDVQFDQKNFSVIVNDISEFKLATYGNIYESIYPKVWPVILKPPEKEKLK
jgi:hypothetical protein